MLCSLKCVIMITMDLLTCVKFTNVLLILKTNIDKNSVKVSDLSNVTVHSMLNQNVKENGNVTILNKSLLITWPIPILMLMVLSTLMMKFMVLNIFKWFMTNVIITEMDKSPHVNSTNVLLILKTIGEMSTVPLENMSTVTVHGLKFLLLSMTVLVLGPVEILNLSPLNT